MDGFCGDDKRDLQADLEMLTGDWGRHEADWFRKNGIEIAVHALKRAIKAEALVEKLTNQGGGTSETA
jgi:hypothetical protein